MDMQTPDHLINSSPSDPAGPLPLALTRCLHHALAAAVPVGLDDSQETRDEKQQAAQVLLDSLQPGDPADAMPQGLVGTLQAKFSRVRAA